MAPHEEPLAECLLRSKNIEERIDHVRELLSLKVDDNEKAILLAKVDLEKRLSAMNEFRDALKDQAARFVTRDEMNIKLEYLSKEKKDNMALILSVIGIIIALISVLLKFFGA